MPGTTVGRHGESPYLAVMPALFLLARSTIRGRRVALGWLALLVALGVGTGIASLTAAWRTDNAYPRYLDEAEVGELVVNPSLLTDRVVEVITSTPGVLEVRSDVLLTATVDSGVPRTGREIDQGAAVQIRASADGRYVEQDRPVVYDGRMVGSGAEAFLNREAAAAFGVGVGDTLPITFWPVRPPDTVVDPAALVEPIGQADVVVVGIGVFADEVLVDELYPRQRILVSPEVAEPYDCLPAHPPPDDSLTIEQLAARLFPAGCSVGYRYFSLRLDGGDAGVVEAMRSLVSRIDRENERLPKTLQDADGYFYLVPAVTADEHDRIERSLAPSITALQLFGLAATGATLALTALAVVRLTRRSQSEAGVWCQLGATRAQRVGAIGVPVGISLAVGLAGAVLLGWLASGIGPVASASAVNPTPGLAVALPVVGAVLAGSLLILGLSVVGAAILAARVTPATGRARRTPLADAVDRTGNVPLALGVRAAFRSGGAAALLGAAVLAVMTVLGSVVFSTNLSAVVSDPARFAWPYDAAAITGGGYGDANAHAVATTLDRPEVESWGIAAVGAATVDGTALPFVAGRAGFDELRVPVVDGELPAGPDQLALGATSAEQLGLAVGSSVTVSTANGEHTGTVSGLVVLPPVGPYMTDRAGLGVGMLLPAAFLEQFYAAAAEETGIAAGELADQTGSFVVINLVDGVDPDRFMSAIGDDLASWDTFGYQPFVHTGPVRPAQIADVAAMQSAPALLAALVASAMTIGLVLAVGLAVRSRRRELAVLRALGATGHQLRATLRWQGLTIVCIGLVLGVPLGVALGRITWRAFAGDLGIPETTAISIPWITVIAVAALIAGYVAGAVPGRIAARMSPSAVLRHE